MKTYLLTLPDEVNDDAVRAALVELLAKQLIMLETDARDLFRPLSEEAFAAEVRTALVSPRLSVEDAGSYLGMSPT